MNQEYEFQQSSENQDSEHQNGFGPCLQQKPILEYQKRQSSMISNPPESLDVTNRNTENPLIQNIKLKLLKQQESFRKFKTKQIQYSSQITRNKTNVKNSAENQFTESMQLVKKQITVLISKLVRNRYIKQFKSNIFLNSYVLPQNHKILLEQEQYLQENEKQSKQRNMQQKSQHIFYPGSRIILTIDSIIVLIQLLSLWFGPLISFFQNIFDQTQILSLIIFLTYLAEISISMNKAIIISGETISERKKIIESYIQSQFYN